MRSEIGKGVTWMVLLRAGDRALGLISTVVLARLLLPEDFGIIAMAMSVIAVVQLATALGFEVPLINKENPERVEFDTAWTLTIIAYVACAAVIVALSGPMAWFFDEPRLTLVLLAVGGGWMLRGFENIGTVEFRRQMNFAREFSFGASKRLVGFIVTITAAIMFRSYWALVAGMVAGAVAGVVLSYAMAPFRPRFSLGAARELFAHSKWLLANNGVIVALVRFPHFLIGRVLGGHSLGLFTLSYEIATMPATELSAPVNRAAFPGYSRMVTQPAEFKRTFLDIGSLVLAVALPAGLGLAVVAEELVSVVLGERWEAAVPIVELLAVSSVFVAASGNNGVAHLALGYTRAVTLQSILRLAVLIMLSAMLLEDYGLVGIAFAELAGGVAVFLASFPLIFSRLNVSLRDYAVSNWRPVAASLLMVWAVTAVKAMNYSSGSFSGAALTLAYSVALGILVYTSSLLLLWWISGRPDGAERVGINKLTAALSYMKR